MLGVNPSNSQEKGISTWDISHECIRAALCTAEHVHLRPRTFPIPARRELTRLCPACITISTDHTHSAIVNPLRLPWLLSVYINNLAASRPWLAVLTTLPFNWKDSIRCHQPLAVTLRCPQEIMSPEAAAPSVWWPTWDFVAHPDQSVLEALAGTRHACAPTLVFFLVDLHWGLRMSFLLSHSRNLQPTRKPTLSRAL